MKKISLLGLACLAILFSCESDTDTVVNERSSFVTPKNGGSEFANLFKSLYNNYTVGVRKAVAADKTVYYYNTVMATAGSSQVLKGYIVQTPKDVFYYEHDAATKRITEYNYEGGKYLSVNFTGGNDPFYGSVGFNPDNNVPAGRRFWDGIIPGREKIFTVIKLQDATGL